MPFRRRRRHIVTTGLVTARSRRRGNRYQRARKMTFARVGFPKTQMIKLRYVSGFTLDINVLPLGTYTFRANSLFDPDVTAGGHQPLGFDQWATFYKTYVVVGSKITLSTARSFPDSIPHIFGCFVSDSPTPAAVSALTLVEQGKSAYLMHASTANTHADSKKLKMTYSAKKWHGLTNIKDADNQEGLFASAFTGDEVYYQVYLGAYDGISTDTAIHYVTVQIDYLVLLKDPLELPES